MLFAPSEVLLFIPTVNVPVASVPAENTRSSLVVVSVVKLPAPPVEFVFQKAFVPQIPFGVVPAPAVAPLLSHQSGVATAGSMKNAISAATSPVPTQLALSRQKWRRQKLICGTGTEMGRK